MTILEKLISEIGEDQCIGDVDKLLASLSDICIFGAGGNGHRALRYLLDKGKNVVAVGDNDPQKIGTKFEREIPILSVCDIVKLDIPVIIASGWSKDIAILLKNSGAKKWYDFTNVTYLYDNMNSEYSSVHIIWEEHFNLQLLMKDIHKIQSAFSLFSDDKSRQNFNSILKYRLTMNPIFIELSSFKQYFHPLCLPQKNMIIADCGAWEGDSAIDFSDYLEHNCIIHAFEPSHVSFKKMLQIDDKIYQDIIPRNLAIGEHCGTVNFNMHASSSMGFYVTDANADIVQCTSLDHEFLNTSLDIIKLDVEGQEINCIIGSINVIKKFLPMLSICVYHKYFDLYEIPLLVASISSKYHMYLGHHSQHLHESVLYASIN
jgi:FkbM family methyltransferase